MTAKGEVTLRSLACGVVWGDWGTDPSRYESLLPDSCIPMARPEVEAYGCGGGGGWRRRRERETERVGEEECV
jgi:hypothetical protein